MRRRLLCSNLLSGTMLYMKGRFTLKVVKHKYILSSTFFLVDTVTPESPYEHSNNISYVNIIGQKRKMSS